MLEGYLEFAINALLNMISVIISPFTNLAKLVLLIAKILLNFRNRSINFINPISFGLHDSTFYFAK